jgi:NADPH-dependent 2,4-dienoyl-CoA reductase/sulfur reductase-like enzyme/rhodanese-related sulfurtransferase
MKRKLIVVGGVAGGASAAARLRRLDESADITVYERGGSVSFANCGLPYYLGGVIENRDDLLVQTPKSLYSRFRIEVKVCHEVKSIDRHRKLLAVRNLISGEEFGDTYDALILSPGAKAIRPSTLNLENNRVFTLRSMEDNDAIKAFLEGQKPKSALIVGAGFIGLEIAENLHEKGIAVTVVEKANQVLTPLDVEMAEPIRNELLKKDIDLRLGCEVASYDAGLATLQGGESVKADFVVLAIGVMPDNSLAQAAGLEVGPRGGIVVDEHMRTSDENIYAVGDAVQVKDFVTAQSSQKPLAGLANKQGRCAADNICGIPSVFSGALGTAIVKVFSLSAGVTGASEKVLKAAEIPYYACWLHPVSHAAYYPGAKTFALKVLFHKESGTLLGAQAVGPESVDKRIDVLATAMRANMTIRDLQDLELSYAPPFSSAKDPVNMAGYVGANILDGYNPPVSWDELAVVDGEKSLILDVRTPSECKHGIIEGAVNIPVDSLRDRLGDLPQDKNAPIYIYCRVGLRGYIAARILQQNGYSRVFNLSGGWLTWTSAGSFRDSQRPL